ncbi:hypothetical protein B0F90DRAFT_319124 [Multifurca ochricompacta]|uniref:Uncharacterized protein n=1 Tax=Multifurca ochricompacta TaxID=376703 RepID=A0AAD4QNW1_9AGAM|nr:hypothetical protein B0F90DRAFT_319124 [Multifurca ochricompacta]
MQNDCGRAIYRWSGTCQSAREQRRPAFYKWITNGESLLSSCPLSHPDRPHFLRLASEKFHHFDNLSYQTSDLNDIVLHLTKAPLPFRVVDGVRLNIVGVFYLLTCAVVRRFERIHQPSDLDYGIKCFCPLLYLPLMDTGTQFSQVAAEFANALL